MFFESRWEPPGVSPGWAEVRAVFLEGDVRRARALAEAAPDWERAEDALLAADIARAHAEDARCAAIVRRAHRRWRTHGPLRLAHAVVTAARGWPLRALELLDGLGPQRGTPLQWMARAAQAYVWARAGMDATARRHAAEVPASALADPRVAYLLATVARCRRDWDAAIELCRRAVDAAPRWPRPRLFHVDALLARGRVDEARIALREALAICPPDAALELGAAGQALARGDLVEADAHLTGVLEGWAGDVAKTALGIGAFVRWSLGDPEGARARAGRLGSEAADRFAAALDGPARRALLPTLLVSQEQLDCVPTVAAMAAAAQGVPLDPRALAVEMGTRHGTPLWRMVDVLRRRGFTVAAVAPRPEVVMGLIEQGVPPIAELEGVFTGHVELVSGFDAALGVYVLRDPVHWAPVILDQAAAPARWSSVGALWAVVAPGRTIDVPDAWWAPAGEALIELQRACARGEREAAERAAARIPDDSPAAFLRDESGTGVVITPAAARRRFGAVAADPEAPVIARVRAFMRLDPDEQAAVFEPLSASLGDLHTSGRRFLRATLLQGQGRWAEALHEVDRLLRRATGHAALWAQRAALLAELGRLDEALGAVRRAREIEPLAPAHRALERRLVESTATFDERLAELEAALEAEPEVHELRVLRATLLLEAGPDGLTCERALRDCLRYLPRRPDLWRMLADWYAEQQRSDLAAAVLAEGRALVGEAELPDRVEETAAESAPVDGGDPDDPLERLARDAFEAVAAAGPGIHPDGLPAVAGLLARQRAGGLRWWQVAQLLALRIRGVQAAFAPPARAAELAALLPDELPGPATRGLETCLEAVPLRELDPASARALLDWATRLAGRGAPDGAAAAIVEGASVGARRLFAALYEAVGDEERARAILGTVVRDAPGDASAHGHLGVLELKRDEPEAALASFERARAVAPGSLAVLRAIARLHESRGDGERAVEAWLAVVRVVPYDPLTLSLCADAVRRVHGPDRALELVEGAAERLRPAHRAALEARILGEAGRADEALRRLPAEADEDWLARHVLVTRLDCALAMTDAGGALAIIDEALARWPDDTWFLENQARLLRERGDRLGARRRLAEAFARGVVSDRLAAELVEAERDPIELARIVEGAPPEARGALADEIVTALEARAGICDEGVALLRWCERALPEAPGLAIRLARALLYRGDAAAAEPIVERLRASQPEDPDVLLLAAEVAERTDPERAIRAYATVWERTGSAAARLALARTYMAAGDAEAAKVHGRALLEHPAMGPSAMLVLLHVEEPASRLWSEAVACLERTPSGELPLGLLLRMAQVAEADRLRLPVAWLRHGLAMLDGVDGPLAEEIAAWLARATGTWLEKWGWRGPARHFERLSKGLRREYGLDTAVIPARSPAGDEVVSDWLVANARPGRPVALDATGIWLDGGILHAEDEHLPLAAIEDVRLARGFDGTALSLLGVAGLSGGLIAWSTGWGDIGTLVGLILLGSGVARSLTSELRIRTREGERRWRLRDERADCEAFVEALRRARG